MEKIHYRETIPGISVERAERDGNFIMQYQHIHDSHYEIYYLFSGERHYLVETQSYYLHSGSLLFLNRGRIHKSVPAETSYHDRFLLELDVSFVQNFLALCGESLTDFFQTDCIVLHFEGEKRMALEQLLNRLAYESLNKKEKHRMMIYGILSQLLVFILRIRKEMPESQTENTHSSPQYQLIEEVAGYIIDHFHEPISLAGISSHFYLNKSYLSRIFKEKSGFTISEYIHLQRCRHACALLEQGQLKISEVSDACGFETITYFERVFKKYIGMSPLKYRKEKEKLSLHG